MRLPDASAWRIDDRGSRWLVAEHAGTASTLVVRTWAEDGRANRARCEERARTWRSLPDGTGADLLQDRAIDAPSGFDTQVKVGLSPPKEAGAAILAFAVAFGAHAHRCVAWAYTTNAAGPGAERTIGERLASMVDGSLGKLELESGLSPKIPREVPGPQRR